jgi:isoleucyl-tRNA synthetase
LYANIDKFNPLNHKVDLGDRPDLDRWTISKLNSLIKRVSFGLDNYDLTRVARQIQEFVIEDLSNWYVRRSRRRFWQSAQTQDKISAYLTLWESIVTICKLIAPYTPFIAEELYQELSVKVGPDSPKEGMPNGSSQSVHLVFFPKAEERYIDKKLEAKMEALRKIASLSRAARNRVGIKIRQPLAEILAKVPKGTEKRGLESLSSLILDEVNVKKISFAEDDICVTEFVAKPNFGRLGPKFGKNANAVAQKIRSLSDEELNRFKKEKKLKLELEGEMMELGAEDLEIGEKEKEGFIVESENEYKVALFTTLTEELKDEGFARELVNKIQNMRRSAGFEVMDRIKVDIKTTPRLYKAIEVFDEYIKSETLAKGITKSGEKGELSKEWDINGEKARISVAKMKK